MTIAQKKAVQNHRQRLKERGLVRLEVQAPEADRPLIRKIASLLRGDPKRAADVRRQLRTLIGEEPKAGLKALLASAPISDEVGSRLESLSQARGQSVDATVMEILECAVGVDERRRRIERYATWSHADLEEFSAALAAQRQIDDELWG